MTFSLLYWILMLAWFIFGLWSNRAPAPNRGRVIGGNLLLFLLFLIVGWRLFGPPVHS